jgi:hypothetical protein
VDGLAIEDWILALKSGQDYYHPANLLGSSLLDWVLLTRTYTWTDLVLEKGEGLKTPNLRFKVPNQISNM